MKKLNKKAFTIVELVIVIAIIAILAAVLIPTFVKLIRKSKINNDVQLIRLLNEALAADRVDNEHNTMTDALAAAKGYGFLVANINAKASGNEILWDSVNDAFVYLNDGEIEYLPDLVDETARLSANDYRLWKIYRESAPGINDQTYSIYCATSEAANSVSQVKVGVDDGGFRIANITYDRSEESVVYDNIVFCTSSAFTTINVTVYQSGANSDTVKHYGVAGIVNLTDAGTTSYHEYGEVGYVDLVKGKLVVEDKGSIELLYSEFTSNVSFSSVRVDGVKHAHATSEENATALDLLSYNISWDYDGDGGEIHPTGVWNIEEGIEEVNSPKRNKEIISQNSDYVARIGDVGYESLMSAFWAVQANDTIVLLKDTTEEDQILIWDNMTLDLNGKTFTYNNSYVSITLNACSLRVKGNGIINAAYDLFYCANFGAPCTLIIENGTFSTYGPLIENAINGSTIIINGGTFNELKAGKSAINLKNSTDLIINDCVINATLSNSNAIHTNAQGKSTLPTNNITINGGEINSYYSNIRSRGADTITVNGGTFSTETSTGTDADETCVISMQAKSGNTALIINDGTFTSMAGRSILNCYNGATKDITVNGGTFNYTSESFVKVYGSTSGARTYHLAEGYEYCNTEEIE